MAHKFLLSNGMWFYNLDYPVGEHGVKKNYANDVLLFQALHNIAFGELQLKFGANKFKEWLREDGIYGPKTRGALLAFLRVIGNADLRIDPIFDENQLGRALYQLNFYASRNQVTYQTLPFTSPIGLHNLAIPGAPPLDARNV